MSLNKILREVTLYITSVFVIRIYFVSLPFFSLPSCTCVLIFSHTALTVGIIIASRGSATKCSKTTYAYILIRSDFCYLIILPVETQKITLGKIYVEDY